MLNKFWGTLYPSSHRAWTGVSKHAAATGLSGELHPCKGQQSISDHLAALRDSSSLPTEAAGYQGAHYSPKSLQGVASLLPVP